MHVQLPLFRHLGQGVVRVLCLTAQPRWFEWEAPRSIRIGTVLLHPTRGA